ncbi:MAG: nucleotidyltransferase family protein [Methylophilaceae bacterium]
MHIIGILLAAGFSRRFGAANKLAHLLPDGRPIGLAAAQNLAAAIPTSIAVIRQGEEALGELFAAAGLTVVTCEAHKQDMADSLATAVKHTADAAPAGFVIALADMPFIRNTTIEMVAQKLAAGAAIVMPTYQGQRGHPVGFSARFRSELENLHGDEGARSIIKAHSTAVQIFACDDPGILADIDTPDDVKKWAI